tara:strand:+ start:21 stop:626 length:606 start_codon:yes stop_codon:yes gene_type:complete
MANNFFNAVKPNISANASAPTTVYTPSGIKAIAIELDAANKSTAGVTITVSIEDNSENASATAASLAGATGIFTDSSHGLVVGDRLLFAFNTAPNIDTGSTDSALLNTKIYYVQAADTNTFKIAETRSAGSPMTFTSNGVSITYIKKAISDIVRDAPVPVGGALKVIAGQKLVLEASDKLYAHCSSANNVDVVASVLADVS